MDVAIAWSLSGILVTLLGVSAVVIVGLLRRNNKNSHGNPGGEVHLVRIEALGEQQVSALGRIETELTAIQVSLGKLETTVGACGAVQELRRRGG